jgi:hypothetical protein
VPPFLFKKGIDMARKRSELEEELMTEANIVRVIKLLEPTEGKAITKKDACQILGMAYNTTRLSSIIDEYKQKQVRTAQRKAELRGKPATQEEIVYIISEYLNSETIDGISKSTFRSPGFVKQILENNDVPIRQTSHDYFNPALIPDGATRERFKVGEIVYSARYDSIARIDMEQKDSRYGWIYRVWLLAEKWKQSAYQEAYELASLEHLRKIGVQI